MDYSIHVLTDISQIEPFKAEMGERKFYDYGIRIYKYFANMEPGDKFDVTKRVAKKNVDKFIKIACLYWNEFPGHIQFNDTFTQITKL